jgi:hypothetical protein
MNTIAIIAAVLTMATNAQADPVMCKNPKSYVCEASGCLPGGGGEHDKDVIIVDLAQKVLTTCFGRDGKCTKSRMSVEASPNNGGYFLTGPASALRLIDDKLAMAVTSKQRIVTQFFQCGKS